MKFGIFDFEFGQFHLDNFFCVVQLSQVLFFCYVFNKLTT